jgi:hypothetical protein
MNMKYQPPKFNDKELLNIFPESREIIPQKIREWEEIYTESREKLKDCFIFANCQQTDNFSKWFLKRVASLFLMPPILEAKRHISRLKRQDLIFNSKVNNLEKWQEKVEVARQYPIAELARNNLELRQTGINFFALCPFHNEKHASFYIYTQTNTFYCFGCQESGDVIKLTMQLYGIDFKEAVQMLQN